MVIFESFVCLTFWGGSGDLGVKKLLCIFISMGWGREPPIPESDVPCNTFCHCCTTMTIIGLMAVAMMWNLWDKN